MFGRFWANFGAAALPIDLVQDSSHVVLAVTTKGGHLGWFDGPLFRSGKTYSQQRWIVKPISEYLTAVVNDLGSDDLPPPRRFRAEGDWIWVEGSEDELYGPYGWKVIQVGEEVEGAEGSGVLAGL